MAKSVAMRSFALKSCHPRADDRRYLAGTNKKMLSSTRSIDVLCFAGYCHDSKASGSNLGVFVFAAEESTVIVGCEKGKMCDAFYDCQKYWQLLKAKKNRHLLHLTKKMVVRKKKGPIGMTIFFWFISNLKILYHPFITESGQPFHNTM